MPIQLSKLPLRSCLSTLALAAVLVLSALGLGQCRIGDETVTGMDTRSNSEFSRGRPRCEKRCNEEYRQCRQNEEWRHKLSKTACRSLSRKEQKECKKAESRRHKDWTSNCRDQRKVCKRGCVYREGSGSAGR
jgi:hypothetical protein